MRRKVHAQIVQMQGWELSLARVQREMQVTKHEFRIFQADLLALRFRFRARVLLTRRFAAPKQRHHLMTPPPDPWSERALAFCMGCHVRLGHTSQILELEEHLMPLILTRCVEKPTSARE